MRKSFLEIPCLSFNKKNFKSYFSTNRLIKGFFIAVLFSVFIYFRFFGIENKIFLNITTSITAFLSFYLLLKEDKKVLFWAGTFIGGLWFYWVSLSFRYYNLEYLIPLILAIFSFGYGVFFYLIGCLKKSYLRALAFLGFSYFHPFGFDWFVPELTLIDSFFDFTKLKFALFLTSIVIMIELKNYYKLLFIPLLLLSVRYEDITLPLSKQKIYLASRNIPQDKKWTKEYFNTLVEDNFRIIDKAIKNNYDIVVLSESVFPYYLNSDAVMIEKLKKLSKKITIVTGSLYSDGVNGYNSTYYFIDGEFFVANKVVLVPFSEQIPLPKFISKFINDTFFEGAEDFKTAKHPTDFQINGEVFRNAICYEATSRVLHENSPTFMIAISNNAWFTPSIEPTLQKLLLRYYSRVYHNTIYHSANSGETGVVRF
jgi:apolipoprotein N-acyltransferase